MEQQSDLFSDSSLSPFGPDPATQGADQASASVTRETFHGRSFLDEEDEKAALLASGRIDEIKPYVQDILSKGQLFSHSNRLMDGRVTSYITSSFATQGETRSESVSDSVALDIAGNAADTPKMKFLLHRYEVAGQSTNLMDAIMHQRPAGLEIVDSAGEDSFRGAQSAVDPLDKRVLLPTDRSGAEYAAWLPKTPAYLMPAMRHAAQTVVLEHAAQELAYLSEAQPSKSQVPATIGVRMKGRLVKRAFYQNFSFSFNQIDGEYPQPVFMPPAGKMTSARRVKRLASLWQQNGRFPWSVVRRQLEEALTDSGFEAVMAHQARRLQTADAIDNVHTRDAYMALGESLSMHFSAIIKAISDLAPKDGVEDAVIEARELLASRVLPASWQQALLNHALAHLIPDVDQGDQERQHAKKRQFPRTESGERHLSRGIASGWLEKGGLSDREGLQTSEAQRNNPDGAKGADKNTDKDGGKDGDKDNQLGAGSYLNITLSASEVDLGSNGISVGVPAPTAIYGFIHNVVERQAGLKIRKFRVGFHHVEMGDQVARDRTIGAFLTAKDQARSSDDTKSRTGIISHLHDGVPLHAKDVALRGGTSQAGTPSTTIPANNKGNAINAPWHTDLKGDVHLTIQVELKNEVDAQDAVDLEVRLSRALSNARLAGGVVYQHHCRVLEEKDNAPPRMGGFGIARHPIEDNRNPLVAVYESVSFMGARYLGDTPLGALSTGYEKLLDAGEMNVRGDLIPAYHAETLYSIFRFCRASGPDNTWFVPRFRDDHFTLCDSLH